MPGSTVELFKQLKLENEELKELLLKLTAKYKSSEIKRNVLMKRNVLLITDNKNLHKQLIESENKRKITESSVSNYYDAFKELQKELKQIKSEVVNIPPEDSEKNKSPLHKAVSCTGILIDPPKDESRPYLDLSDVSETSQSEKPSGDRQKVNVDQKKTSSEGTCEGAVPAVTNYCTNIITEGASLTEAEVKEQSIMSDEMQTRLEVALGDKLPKNKQDGDENDIISETQSMPDCEDLMKKQERLWRRIKELKEMGEIRDKELQTRRFAMKAKVEMIQNASREIERMQKLIALTKQ